MLKILLFYFELAWLCCRLFFNLAFFILRVLLKKIGSGKFSLAVVILLILIIWTLNVLLVISRNTPQILVQKKHFKQNLSINQNKLTETMSWNELEEKKQFYESLKSKRIENLYLFLNLYQLNQITNNQEIANQYLDLAKNINPQIKE